MDLLVHKAPLALSVLPAPLDLSVPRALPARLVRLALPVLPV